MPNPENAPLSVGEAQITQADRDAACDAYRRFRYGQPPLYVNIGAGRIDHDPIVQAFARHRHAALATEKAKTTEPVVGWRTLADAHPAIFESIYNMASRMIGVSDTGALHIWIADNNCGDDDLIFCLKQDGITEEETNLVVWALENTTEGERSVAWQIFSDMAPPSQEDGK